MKIIFQLISLSLLIGCSPKISKEVKSSFQKVKLALETADYSHARLEFRFPDFQVQERTFFKEEAQTKLEKAIIQLKEKQVTELISNKDKSCSMSKVLKIEPSVKMRVSYIYLDDKTKEGEKLADTIITAYKNGVSFTGLEKKYSKYNAASKNTGDTGWFEEKIMVKDFVQAIRNHKKGEIFKALTQEYGWYVILNTHEILERTVYKVVEVSKENCN